MKSQRWRKWVIGDTVGATVEEVLRNPELTKQITDICGHYTYEIPEVSEQLERLMANLKSIGIDGRKYTMYKLKESLDRYAFCFGMYGLTSRLLKEAERM